MDKIPRIIGFPKCGTSALEQFMAPKFIYRIESAFWPDSMKKFNPDVTIPVFILRDPVKRVWSTYFFFRIYEKMSFREYLKPSMDKGSFTKNSGLWDFAETSNYTKFIEPYLQYDPFVFKLEEIAEHLPLRNGGAHPPLTESTTKMIEEAVTQENIELYKNIKTSDFSKFKEFMSALNY